MPLRKFWSAVSRLENLFSAPVNHAGADDPSAPRAPSRPRSSQPTAGASWSAVRSPARASTPAAALPWPTTCAEAEPPQREVDGGTTVKALRAGVASLPPGPRGARALRRCSGAARGAGSASARSSSRSGGCRVPAPARTRSRSRCRARRSGNVAVPLRTLMRVSFVSGGGGVEVAGPGPGVSGAGGGGSGAKTAVALRAALIVSWQSAEPVQSPPHPSNRCPAAGLAVSVTVSPG